MNKQYQKSMEEEGNQRKKWSISDFICLKKVGEGSFGEVFLARERSSNCIVCLKAIQKSKIMYSKQVSQMVNEIEINMSLSHKLILKFYGYFYDEESIYLILEYAPNGSLYNKVMDGNHLDEKTAVEYFMQLCEVLIYVHNQGVMHRDIKLENILIGIDGKIRLCDFGLAVQTQGKRITKCGTEVYFAPEIEHRDEYGKEIDIWALGIILCELLCGETPTVNYKNPLSEKKEYESVTFPDSFYSLKEEARNFIFKFLNPDPNKRITLEEAIRDPWPLNILGKHN